MGEHASHLYQNPIQIASKLSACQSCLLSDRSDGRVSPLPRCIRLVSDPHGWHLFYAPSYTSGNSILSYSADTTARIVDCGWTESTGSASDLYPYATKVIKTPFTNSPFRRDGGLSA